MGVFFHVTWLLVAGLLLFFEFRSKLRLNHPPVLDEGAPLGVKRRILAAVVVLIFVLSFTPDPIRGAGLIDLLSGAWGAP
jgi:hypothetical protein